MPDRAYDDDFDVKSETQRMFLAMSFLADLNLQGLTEVVRDAHTIGPIVDPTAYRDALWRGDMDRMARIAEALKEPVRLYKEVMEEVNA